ncbi:SDR family oxidoreductase [Actinosynnema pretiosum subsp. pretiosum]|uniref:Short-chain dehydrogenase/reductase SDR n=2 Tax=Actinosynnema TaxID=40566 RepID=C6WSE7_ACTMD|nr:SDR family oxidoreductase [Actinosynnema mirum]ACU40817.1 short-chain dehydrogenase/reductase SDR [Actinosynnema mirum DSM 43827]AXX34324.1 short-chain dehydrogenase/reductase SDR [Actinosynnema pretiosum subsp. pretiosum]QUF01974.1 SDR family oxidoreductase [Actinosynnema pretiosum subsp. pretiosum]
MTERPAALITGASRGIGAAVARALAPTHDVLLGGRDEAALRALADELPGARPFAVELTDAEALAGAVAGIERLDVLVHSAGVAELGPLSGASAEVWRRTLEVNVVAVAELTRLALPLLREARGDVVLINSGAGLRANPGWGVYAASKFALRAFGDVLRAEEPALRVTSVHPGRVDTDMQRDVRQQEGGEYEAELYLRAESVADAVARAVLAGDDAHITEIVVRPRTRLG